MFFGCGRRFSASKAYKIYGQINTSYTNGKHRRQPFGYYSTTLGEKGGEATSSGDPIPWLILGQRQTWLII